MPRRFLSSALALIILVGVFLRSQDILTPWTGVHNAWGGAVLGNIARNYLKYGYTETKLGQVSNTGLAEPAEFEFYLHYPPLSVLLTSVSFHLFGVHEWSARLVPWIFSVLILGLTYLVARRLYGQRVALLAAAMCAALPMEIYYGTHLDYYGSIAVFFSLLAVYGYIRWLDTRRRWDFALCLAGVALGAMTAWFTYFVVPFILVHFYWFHRRPGKSPGYALLILPLTTVVIFGVFLIQRNMALHHNEEVMGTMTGKLSARIIFGGVDLPLAFTRHLHFVLKLFTPPVLVLALGWLVFFLRDLRQGQPRANDWFVVMLFGYGAVHNLIFPGFLAGHDYMGCCYSPAFAIAAAVGADRFLAIWRGETAPEWKHWAASLCLLMIFGLVLILSHRQIAAVRRSAPFFENLRRVGELIHEKTSARDVILLPKEEDHVLAFYIDRRTQFSSDTFEQITSTVQRHDRKYFFACSQQSAEGLAELLQKLDARYPKISATDPVIYDLTRRTP